MLESAAAVGLLLLAGAAGGGSSSGAPGTNCAIAFAPGCVWPSAPPPECPLASSAEWTAVQFGAGRDYEDAGIRADTWYPTWAADGDLWTPFEDGQVVVSGSSNNTTVAAEASRNGWAILRGDDAMKLEVVAAVRKMPPFHIEKTHARFSMIQMV